MKKSYVMYLDWTPLICGLPDEKAGQLIKAICRYQSGEDVKVDDPILSAVLSMILKRMEKDAIAYSEICEKRREARLGKTKDNKRYQLISSDKKSQQKPYDNENDNDNENDINNKRAKRFVPPTLQEVKAYCQERGNKVDAEQFVNFYESKNWMVGKNKMRDWRASVRTWEKRAGTTKNAFNRIETNSYDFDDLERTLIETYS